jgi:hypothetical protein
MNAQEEPDSGLAWEFSHRQTTLRRNEPLSPTRKLNHFEISIIRALLSFPRIGVESSSGRERRER